MALTLSLSAQETTEWWFAETDGKGVAATAAHQLIDQDSSLKPSRVIVAVLDGGTDTYHEDLAEVIWVNEGEIEGNLIDDDGNGYVDDIHGWSMLSGPGGVIGCDNTEMVRMARDLKARKAAGEKLSKEDKRLLKELNSKIKKEVKQAKRTLRFLKPLGRAADDIVEECGEDYTVTCVHQVKESGRGFLYKTYCTAIANLKTSGWSNYELDQKLFAGYRQFNDHVLYHFNMDYDPMASIDQPLGDNQVVGGFAEHGTHVAGIIAAQHDNNMGVKGIADNVDIMVLRVVPNGDERDEQVAEAIRYAVDNGASIINMSFGKSYSANPEVVDEATRYAESHDVLMIHAAGNEATNLDEEICYPNAVDEQNQRTYSHWIEVGASTPFGTPAAFSNYGQYVDVFAPGASINSTMPGNHYLENDGTSMAAPVVSGVAAVLRGLFPELTAAQIKQILMRSAVVVDTDVRIPGSKKEVPFSELTASGVVNLEYAIRLAKTFLPQGAPESLDVPSQRVVQVEPLVE